MSEETLRLARGMAERKIHQRIQIHGDLARVDDILDEFVEQVARDCAEIRLPESSLMEHTIQLGAISMAGINNSLWETRNKLILYIEEKLLAEYRATIRAKYGIPA